MNESRNKFGDGSEAVDQTSGQNPDYPTAVIRESKMAAASAPLMWIIALLCLGIAIGLVWWSLPEPGVEISVHFPDGHGLEADDAVRFRGIDVGKVTKVQLNAKLTGVDVKVSLKPDAASLAREGTRFWIVRPEVTLTEISGLETAVGNKYIGLLPGDSSGSPCRAFDGLASSPPDALENSGMEIVIRGNRRSSVSQNSPVYFRGVEVGRVLSVGLSYDARFVDVRARIFDQFVNLINTETVFFSSGGLKLEYTIGGRLELGSESLETIARGGVSFLTIESGGEPVKPGHVFTLHEKMEKDWYEKAAKVSLTGLEFTGTLPLDLQWKQSLSLSTFSGSRNRRINAIPIQEDNGARFLVAPRESFELPKSVSKGSPRLELFGKQFEYDTTNLPPLEEIYSRVSKPMVKIPYTGPSIKDVEFLDSDQVRSRDALENCVVVRATYSKVEKNVTFLHDIIDVPNLSNEWVIKGYDGDRDVWQGAAVVSIHDNKLLGQLVIGRKEAKVVGLDGQSLLDAGAKQSGENGAETTATSEPAN